MFVDSEPKKFPPLILTGILGHKHCYCSNWTNYQGSNNVQAHSEPSGTGHHHDRYLIMGILVSRKKKLVIVPRVSATCLFEGAKQKFLFLTRRHFYRKKPLTYLYNSWTKSLCLFLVRIVSNPFNVSDMWEKTGLRLIDSNLFSSRDVFE